MSVSLQIYGASKGNFTLYCRSNSNPINLAVQILKFHTYKTAENVERRGEAKRCNERLSEDLDVFLLPRLLQFEDTDGHDGQ